MPFSLLKRFVLSVSFLPTFLSAMPSVMENPLAQEPGNLSSRPKSTTNRGQGKPLCTLILHLKNVGNTSHSITEKICDTKQTSFLLDIKNED